MSSYNFGEKTSEYSPKAGGEVPVWQSPKYMEAKAKAIEILDSGKYDLQASDFWILMNATKSGKMAYTGLILSHNGCLKINDALDRKFDPACVTLDKSGYRDSLVYTYCNPVQGIYEVGEVSAANCKNEYPYAMAFKRLFDRVVLKLSKLAYAGIYSDSESDEFSQQIDEKPEQKPDQLGSDEDALFCESCGREIQDYYDPAGRRVRPKKIAEQSLARFGRILCVSCASEEAG